jgi:hypothetical protein
MAKKSSSSSSSIVVWRGAGSAEMKVDIALVGDGEFDCLRAACCGRLSVLGTGPAYAAAALLLLLLLPPPPPPPLLLPLVMLLPLVITLNS